MERSAVSEVGREEQGSLMGAWGVAEATGVTWVTERENCVEQEKSK